MTNLNVLFISKIHQRWNIRTLILRKVIPAPSIDFGVNYDVMHRQQHLPVRRYRSYFCMLLSIWEGRSTDGRTCTQYN